MQFWEHLEELRWMFFKIFGVLTASTCLSFLFVDNILNLFTFPISIVRKHNPHIVIQEVLTSPFDGVLIKLKIAFLVGLVIGLPLVMYVIWGFVKHAFMRNEKHIFSVICIFGCIAFAFGLVCSYLLIIPAVSAMLKMGITSAENLWSLKAFINFEFYWMLCGGIVFELPLVMILLVRLGVIEIKTFKQKRPYYIVVSLVIAAVITPTTDPFTLCLVMIPLVLLYEVGIIIAALKFSR